MGISYTYTDLLYGDDIELPTQAMISSSYKDKYYIGYLDSENSTYMSLIHNRTTGKDIDIKINGKLFFSVILGDDYFILLDSDISTCNQTECKKTHMKKYNYDGNVIEVIDNSFIMLDTDVTVEVVFKELVNPKTGYFDYIFGAFIMIGAATILFLYSDKRQKTIE